MVSEASSKINFCSFLIEYYMYVLFVVLVAGVFDDTITEMCQELKSGIVPILIPTPNSRNDLGYNRDRF